MVLCSAAISYSTKDLDINLEVGKNFRTWCKRACERFSMCILAFTVLPKSIRIGVFPSSAIMIFLQHEISSQPRDRGATNAHPGFKSLCAYGTISDPNLACSVACSSSSSPSKTTSTSSTFCLVMSGTLDLSYEYPPSASPSA